MMGIFHKKRGNQESQNIPLDIQKAFEENLKYISSTEIDVDAIKKQFVKTNTRFYLTI